MGELVRVVSYGGMGGVPGVSDGECECEGVGRGERDRTDD